MAPDGPLLPCEKQKGWCWKIFATTCGVFTMAFIILTGYVIANEDRRVATLSAHEIKNGEQFEKLTEKMTEGFSDVKQRLSRIEAKIP